MTRFNETLRSTSNEQRTTGLTAKERKNAKGRRRVATDAKAFLNHGVAEVSGGTQSRRAVES